MEVHNALNDDFSTIQVTATQLFEFNTIDSQMTTLTESNKKIEFHRIILQKL